MNQTVRQQAELARVYLNPAVETLTTAAAPNPSAFHRALPATRPRR